MTLSTIRAAIVRLFHRSPPDQTMPNNTALAAATAALTTATQRIASISQQLATATADVAQARQDAADAHAQAATALAAQQAAEAHAADLQTQLDQLPDAATVDAAVQAETAAAQAIDGAAPTPVAGA